MKSIRMFTSALLTAFILMIFAANSAMGEGTALCTSHEIPCSVGHTVIHVHETTLSGAKAVLLSSVINIECDVLFLGDILTALNASGPVTMHGHYTHTNCGNCEVTEESEDSLIQVLRTAHELATVTGNREVRFHCGFFINCVYDEENLSGHALGPLLSSHLKGSVIISEQVTHKVSGFCPETAKLDITTTPLEHIYISR